MCVINVFLKISKYRYKDKNNAERNKKTVLTKLLNVKQHSK